MAGAVGGHLDVVCHLREDGSMLSDQWNHEPEAAQAEPGNYYWSMVLPVVTGDLDTTAKMHQRGILGDGQEVCLLAAANGQAEVVQYLHRSGCDLFGVAAKALPLAAANGRLDIVRYFHTRGCDIRAQGDAAIKAAAGKGHLAVIRYLHENGSDIHACRQAAHRLPLSHRAKPAIEYLASNGVFPEGLRLMSLISAIPAGNLRAIEANIRDFDLRLYSAMIVRAATEVENTNVVALLHQRGCDIHAENDLALRIAAERGYVQLLQYLHQNGANIRARDDEALRAATENGHLQIVAYLIGRGADITTIGEESLELARLNGHVGVLNYLTDSGLDAISRHRPVLTAMREELYAANPVYRPSKLWEHFSNVNIEQLRRSGMNSFKRSVNQNYFNFLPYSLFDSQLLKLMGWWARHLTLTPFELKVIDPDVDPEGGRLLPVNRRVFALGHRHPALSWIARNLRLDVGRNIQLTLYRWLVVMLWDYTAAHDKLGLATTLVEPRLGSPIEIYHQGRLVSQDLAHSILECNSILGEIGELWGGRPLRVAEIGAGYGRLGFVMLHAVKCQYVVIDIPPSLFVSQWYLSEMFPKKRVFCFRHFDTFEEIAAELAQADIAFFSANQIELVPDGYFDLSINISSLHELRPDQIDNMLHQIYRVTQRLVYLKQYKEYINPYDGLRIREDSYSVARGWKRRFYRSDPVDPRFFEALIEADSPPATGDQAARTELSSAARHLTKSVSEPTVSVLFANYNDAEYLPTSLAGICGQTKPATEIIIIDDGSTDDSVAVIEDYARRFPNIQLIKNDRNRGQSYSIQRALLAARGDYVVWAAADDLLLPRFIERSLAVLKTHPEAGLCFSRLSVFVDGTPEVRHFTVHTHGAAFDYGQTPQFIPSVQLAALLRRHYLWISGNTVMARRSALLEMGGFEQSLRWHADWFAYYAVALRYGACVIPEILALMRERPGTYSGSGISDPVQQSKVFSAILDIIKLPKYRDLLPIFIRRPSLLSLFGRRGLYVALRNPRHWRIAWALARWHGLRLLRRIYHGVRRRVVGLLRRIYHGVRRWVAARKRRPNGRSGGNGNV